MPLQSAALSAKLRLRIERRISELVKQEILLIRSKKHPAYEITFCMPIQIVPKLSGSRFSFGKPEGLRVFISSGKKVVAAVDFVYAGKMIRFARAYQGPRLNQLVRTLDYLKAKFAAKRGKYFAEVLSVLYSPGVYILIRSERKRTFFRNIGRRTDELTVDEIKEDVYEVMSLQPQPDEI